MLGDTSAAVATFAFGSVSVELLLSLLSRNVCVFALLMSRLLIRGEGESENCTSSSSESDEVRPTCISGNDVCIIDSK